MDQALHAGPLSVALRHLELARLHREQRSRVAAGSPLRPCSACSIDRTDKEG
jgi:DTW domain-containing protein YfiP